MYSQLFELQASLYKSLANPKRVEIIQLLRDKELTVNEMIDMLGLPQANLSQHLQVLRSHQMVTTRRRGKQIYYKLSHPNISKASDSLRDILIDHYKGNGIAIELKLKMKELVPIVKDPICGMRISPKTASYMVIEKGTPVYFCAKGCMNEFQSGKSYGTR